MARPRLGERGVAPRKTTRRVAGLAQAQKEKEESAMPPYRLPEPDFGDWKKKRRTAARRPPPLRPEPACLLFPFAAAAPVSAVRR